MAIGDILGNAILGGGHSRQYTPDEQAAISRAMPGVVWRDGVPYTTQPEVASNGSPNPQFDPAASADNTPGTLTEADLNNPNFLAQLGRLVAISSAAEAGAGALNGSAGAGVSAAPSAAPPFSAPVIPSLSGATLPGAATTLSAPAAATAASTAATAAPAAAASKSLWERLIEPKTLAQAGSVLGKAAGAMTSNREDAAKYGLTATQLQEILNQNREQSDRDWLATQDTTSRDAWNSAVKAALAKNLQDTHFDTSQFKTAVPDISFGGVKPSAVAASLAPAADALNNQALQRLLNPVQAPTRAPLDISTSLPDASVWEKLAGPGAFGLSLLGSMYGGNK